MAFWSDLRSLIQDIAQALDENHTLPGCETTRRAPSIFIQVGEREENDGFRESIRDEARTQQPPTQRVIIVQREVLRVPCRYCGTPIDPVKTTKCPSCGRRPI